MTQGQNDDISNMEFEQAMRELEDIVSTLESSSTSLKNSVALYERGVLLKSRCEYLLDSARMKIQQIMQEKDGEISIEDITGEE